MFARCYSFPDHIFPSVLFLSIAIRKPWNPEAVAISTQLDYHYFQATNEDSIIYYTNKVKDFAKATQQPKYYYFAWSTEAVKNKNKKRNRVKDRAVWLMV